MPYSSKPAESDMSGMIQSCGALLVLSADLGQVLQASDNLAEVAGVSPDTALAHGPGKVLGHALWQRLSRELQGRARLAAAVVISRRVAGQVRRLQVDLHRQGERVFVEIEPLHASSNKRRLLATVSGWLVQLAAADHPDRLLETLVEGVQSITGHDRVLVASFDAEGHGAVVAESVAAKVPSLMGMRFPASDFPPQMREVFERQAVRSVPDVEAASVPLRPRRDPLTGAPVDLSAALLRGLSSAQRHYLRAMQVRAVLTVAMQGDAGLWGLLICHGMAAHPISPLARDAVVSLVQMTTQRLFLLKARREARYLEEVRDSRELLGRTAQELPEPVQLLDRHGGEWRALFRAQGVALIMPSLDGGEGTLPAYESLARLVARLNDQHCHQGPWTSHTLAEEALAGGLDLGEACGLMAVPFPIDGTQRGWLLLFRGEQRETHAWAGMPRSGREAMAPATQPLLGQLFEQWREEVRGRSAPWERIERLAAMDLAEDLGVMAAAQQIHRLYADLRREREALAEANRRLERLAHYDPLTQSWNRYSIERALDAEIGAAERYGRPLAVLLFDIDHFKQINDQHGHEMGDRVLTELAAAVEGRLRGSDFLGRWGGEEFVVVASHCGLESGLGLAERLRAHVAALSVPGLSRRITISIGVATWQPGDTRKSLLARADAAMYRAKHGGRNRVES